jgi:hypothetical protein
MLENKMAQSLLCFCEPKIKNMKKTTLMIAAAFFTFTAFSQTNTATGNTNDQGTQNQTNQGNQNNQNNVPKQNPTGQDNNVNKSDWNNQKGQSEQMNQKNQHQTQTGQGQTQNQNQSDFGGNTSGGMPPSTVTNRFTTDYPGMTPSWTTDHVNNYRASYKDAGSNSSRSVTYDKNGNVISRDMELGDNDYPTGIKDYFNKNKMNNKHSVWSSEDKDGKKIYYSTYDNKTYWFDKDGKYQDNKGTGTGKESGTSKDKNSKNNNNSKEADKTAPKKDKSTNKETRKDPQ